MTLTTERGFGVGIAIAIIAIAALIGGGAYVATQKNVDVKVDETASTTDDVNGTIKIEITDATTTLDVNSTTTIDVDGALDIDADVNGGASVN